MAGKPVGTAVAEIELDLNKFQKSLERVKTDLLSTTGKTEDAFKALGVRSDRTFEMMRQNATLAFDKIKASAQSSTADISRAQEAMTKKISDLNKQQFGEHDSFLTKMKTNWLGASAIVVGALGAMHGAWSLLKQGADFAEQKGLLDNLAKKYQTTADDIVAAMQRASEGLIAKSDLMAISLEGLGKGLKPDQMIKLAEAAAILGDVVGKSATVALQELSQALETGRTKALKGYAGATLDLADTFGELESKLTAAEKTQAMYALIMIHATKLQKDQTKAVDDTADKIERLEAQYKNVIQSAANFFKVVVVGTVNMFDMEAKALRDIEWMYKSGYMTKENYEKKKVELTKQTTDKEKKENKSTADQFIAQLDAQLAGLKSIVGARTDAAEATKKGAIEAERAAKIAQKANEDLDALLAGSGSAWNKAVADIDAKYRDLVAKGADQVKAKEWHTKAMAELWSKDLMAMQQAIALFPEEYDKALADMKRFIEEGEKLGEQWRKARGIKTEEEEWAQNADDAIKEMERFITVGSELGDQWRNQQAQANDTFFGGLKAGFDEMVAHQYTSAEMGKEIWHDFHQALTGMVSDQVNLFIRGEDAKVDILKASGQMMANLAGEISTKMYSAAIEKIISIIGALIGEAAGGAAAAGSLKGGVAGALAEMGIFLGAGVAAMLGGRAMASSFKAEGGWVAGHPGGGWIREGSGSRDDVFLGMTPGVRHWGMGGEFVVNKESAAKHSELLHSINRDRGHDGGGPINDSWEPLADMFVIGTLASALHGFYKGFIPGAIAEAVAFNISAIGGAFGGKILGELFAPMMHADGGAIQDQGHFWGSWLNPFNNPVTRAIGLPNPGEWLPGWLPEPGRAIESLDPEKMLEMLKAIVREPYKQVAKDLLTPGINWSSPIDGISSSIKLLEGVLKSSLGFKHSGGIIGEDERIIVAQTGEGIVSRKGINALGMLNSGYDAGGYIPRTRLETYANIPKYSGPEISPEDLARQQREIGNMLKEAYGRHNEALIDRRKIELESMHESLRGTQLLIWEAERIKAYEEKEIDLMKALGMETEALALERAEELKKLDPTVRAIQAAIWAQELANEKSEMQVKLLKAQGYSTEALAKERERELKVLDPSLRGLQKAIWAQELANDKRALEIELLEASGKDVEALAKKREDELRALDPSLKALKQQIWATQDAKKAEEALAATRAKIAKSDYATLVDYKRAVAYAGRVKGFASGGYHSGGWRVVGEGGPELEYTGPSRIFNSGQMLGGNDSGQTITTDEFFQLGLALEASTRRTAKLLDKWDGEGQPGVRDSDGDVTLQ